MMSETEICQLFSSRLPSGRLNGCFECDAEILRLPETQALFSTDEFSAEDLFREEDAYRLGWNIAAGALSDLFACGGVPWFYAQALTVCPAWDAAFLTRFCDGLRDVLLASGARFIGGDCGRAQQWRCTASVIGGCPGRPVQRRGARSGDRIYLTGEVGAGNLEAALRLAQQNPALPGPLRDLAAAVQTQFPVRLKESELVRQFASAAIDTSDGVCKSLNLLANLNGCGYRVADLPYGNAGLRFCEAIGWPKELLGFGECGEYELVFTVPPNREADLLAHAQAGGSVLHCLGEMTPSGRLWREADRELDLSLWRLEARDFAGPQEYLQAAVTWLERSR